MTTAALRFHYGPMNSGKSAQATALDYVRRSAGLTGVRFTKLDRSGNAAITSRNGTSVPAIEVTADLDLAAVVREQLSAGVDVRYVIVDEVQFYSVCQIEQLADIVDDLSIPVHAFGIATDFASVLFPGAKRLFEIADEHIALPVQGLCWCGEPARMNARVVHGEMVVEGEQVVVGDTAGADTVRYVLLCRPHYRSRQHQATAPAQALSADRLSIAA